VELSLNNTISVAALHKLLLCCAGRGFNPEKGSGGRKEKIEEPDRKFSSFAFE